MKPDSAEANIEVGKHQLLELVTGSVENPREALGELFTREEGLAGDLIPLLAKNLDDSTFLETVNNLNDRYSGDRGSGAYSSLSMRLPSGHNLGIKVFEAGVEFDGSAIGTE